VRHRAFAVTLVALLAIAAATRDPVGAQQPSVEALREAAGSYVRSAFSRLANLVATESYTQELRRPGIVIVGRQLRRLNSEVLLVPHPAEPRNWLFFRDVLEVDGKAIPNHQDRLNRLFLNPTAANWELVREIAHADRQYHLPGSTAAEANPFVMFALMDRAYWPRLTFSRGREDRGVAPGTWTLLIDELPSKEAPILTAAPARGTVWIEAATGRILRTELRLDNDFGGTTSRTRFRYDDTLMVTVPVEMRTAWRPQRTALVEGTARYSNFRRFSVSTDESLKGDSQ
jgi:hypothetical protein